MPHSTHEHAFNGKPGIVYRYRLQQIVNYKGL